MSAANNMLRLFQSKQCESCATMTRRVIYDYETVEPFLVHQTITKVDIVCVVSASDTEF